MSGKKLVSCPDYFSPPRAKNSLGTRLGKSIPSFAGGELSFLKLGSVLVGLSARGVSNFS